MNQYKKNKCLLLFFTLLLGVGGTGCTLQRMVRTAEKEQVITVTPSPLAANSQSVNFELKAQVPDKLVREDETYKLDIYYEYDQKREDVATYGFRFGEFIYEDGMPTVIRQLSFPYSPNKNPGRLMVQAMPSQTKTATCATPTPDRWLRGSSLRRSCWCAATPTAFCPTLTKRRRTSPAG